MKNLLMITAIFLLGIGSLSAQANWEARVQWNLGQSDCADYSGDTCAVVVGITIVDEANSDAIVCYSVANNEPLSASYSDFTALQIGVQSYCGGNPLNTPSFAVIVQVTVYNKDTHETYCVAKRTEQEITCSFFSAGYSILANW
jgi:hypothetical protein